VAGMRVRADRNRMVARRFYLHQAGSVLGHSKQGFARGRTWRRSTEK
jgi:hypothetical protein